MDKLTKKEEIIVKNLVKKYSKEDLDQFIDDYIDDGRIPESLKTMIKMIQGEDINLSGLIENISIQYIQYAYEYYQNIEQGDFSNDIERVKSYSLILETTEEEVVYKDYSVDFATTPSLLNRKTENIKDNFFTYNFESDTVDYGDSHIVEETFREPKENKHKPLSKDKLL